MALIKCPECERDISDKASICPHCGCPISNLNNDSSSTDASTSNDSASTNTKLPSKKMNIIVILSISILFIIVVLVLVICFKKGLIFNDSDPLNSTNCIVSTESDFSSMPFETESSSVIPTLNSEITEPEKSVLTYLEYKYITYDSTNKTYQISIVFSDQNHNSVSPTTGSIVIDIINDEKEKVYSDTIRFKKSDFKEITYNGENLLCYACFVKETDIHPGLSDDGTITATVFADELEFGSFNNIAYNLPVKKISIALPSLPREFSDYDYYHNVQSTIRIDSITYEQDTFVDPDSITVSLHVLSTTLYNNTPSISKISHVGYKIKNSSGVIVDSGTMMINSSTVGDVTESKERIFGLSLRDTYTIELIDSIG